MNRAAGKLQAIANELRGFMGSAAEQIAAAAISCASIDIPV
ncbi:MAG: hypothetical protein WA384_18915 [Rhodomicrobium sp.]